MYSVNVPVPSEVSALASRLARDLPRARGRPRGEHTLVVKRLVGEGGDHQQVARARDVLADAPTFRVRITGIDLFARPTSGAGPVVYLAVESPGLERLHYRLASAFDPVEGIEGEAYVPHVTIARGGPERAAHRITDRQIDPIEWTASELVFWDGDRNQPAGRVSLPA